MENLVSIDYLKSFNPKAVIYNRLIQQEENRCQELTIVDEEGEYENIIKANYDFKFVKNQSDGLSRAINLARINS